MKILQIIGYDPSIYGTGVFIHNLEDKDIFYTYTIHAKEDFFYEDEKIRIFVEKRAKKFPKDDYRNVYEVAKTVQNFVMYYMKKPEETFIFMEQFLWNIRGKMSILFEIHSALSFILYENGYEVKEKFSNNVAKKQVWGKGNMKKDEIYGTAYLHDYWGSILQNLKKQGIEYKKGIWMEDMLDSYAIAMTGKKKFYF